MTNPLGPSMSVSYRIMLSCALMFLLGQRVGMAEPDYQALSRAIHRVENGTFEPGTGKGEQYGIHSVHYRDAQEAREIAIRTATGAWKRYRASTGLEMASVKGYMDSLSRRYCPGNARNWARMVGYYYKGGI